MGTLKNFAKIVDLQTIVISVLAVLSTSLCVHFSYRADMPTGIIGIAIIFPIVFSINAAYRRREEALKFFASLKSHAAAIYYAHRDWIPDASDQPGNESLKVLPKKLLHAVKECLSSEPGSETGSRGTVYEVFSMYSREHEQLRERGVPTGEVCRCNQYLRTMIIDFERMFDIHNYRTPVALRAYSRVFLNTFPIIYAPYFAHLIGETTPAIGYTVAVLYSLVLVSLDNIQEALEDPFDDFGADADDIDLDIAETYTSIL